MRGKSVVISDLVSCGADGVRSYLEADLHSGRLTGEETAGDDDRVDDVATFFGVTRSPSMKC